MVNESFFKNFPDRLIHFIRRKPVDTYQFVRVEGKVFLRGAAVSAAFSASQFFVSLFFFIPYRNCDTGVRNCICIKEHRKPGQSALFLWKVQTSRKSWSFFCLFFHELRSKRIARSLFKRFN